MIRVTNSIALRFDVIGKTLETLMDKQLMKTTVNDELSSEKNMPERKSVLRQENYLIIPLKTFFGDTLGGEDMHLRFAVSRYITSNHAP